MIFHGKDIPFPKLCRLCEKRFFPRTRCSTLCDSCREIRKIETTAKQVQTRNKLLKGKRSLWT